MSTRKKNKHNNILNKNSNNELNSIKKPLSATRNKNSKFNKNNPSNTKLNLNNIHKEPNKKRNISLNSECTSKNLIQNKEKICIDLYEKIPISCNNRKNINSKLNLNKELDIQTQKENDYNIKVKKYMLDNTLKNNRSYNNKINKNGKNKSINRNNSSINNVFNKINLEENINYKKVSSKKKLNENNNAILINNGDNNKNNIQRKSRNSKNSTILYYKNNSIENKKINGLSSTTLTFNMKTMYKQINRNKNLKNKSSQRNNNKEIEFKKIKSFHNKNNLRENIPSNYTQIYLNQMKNQIDNGIRKNQSIMSCKSNILNKIKFK